MREHSPSHQTENICMTFIQFRPNVFDIGPALYKCYKNVLRLLGSQYVGARKQSV